MVAVGAVRALQHPQDPEELQQRAGRAPDAAASSVRRQRSLRWWRWASAISARCAALTAMVHPDHRGDERHRRFPSGISPRPRGRAARQGRDLRVHAVRTIWPSSTATTSTLQRLLSAHAPPDLRPASGGQRLRGGQCRTTSARTAFAARSRHGRRRVRRVHSGATACTWCTRRWPAAAVGSALGMTDAGDRARASRHYQHGGRPRAGDCDTPKLTIVSDCYNANPSSAAAAIESLRLLAGRKVCVLGDMLELGENTECAAPRKWAERAVQRGRGTGSDRRRTFEAYAFRRDCRGRQCRMV